MLLLGFGILKKEFIRINGEDRFDFSAIEINDHDVNIGFQNKDIRVDISNIRAYWYRRGSIVFNKAIISEQPTKQLQASSNIFIDRENTAIRDFVYHQLEAKRSIGKISQNLTNKVTNLVYAQRAGLKVPVTRIVTTKKDLKDFIDGEQFLLTKPITQSGFSFSNNEIKFEGLSSLFEIEHLDVIPDKFSPTLFQRFIDKAYELRIFYLDKTCYTSAIFLQNDEQTIVDFRDYNYDKPNRTPPYKLPQNITEANSAIQYG